MTTTNQPLFDSLQQRRHTSGKEAREKFAESTRSAAFSLSLGIREIRLLRDHGYNHAWSMQPMELGTLQKLIDKGLIQHTYGESPTLSHAGELVRDLLLESKHIVEEPKTNPFSTHTVRDYLSEVPSDWASNRAIEFYYRLRQWFRFRAHEEGLLRYLPSADSRRLLDGPTQEAWAILHGVPVYQRDFDVPAHAGGPIYTDVLLARARHFARK